MNKQDNRELYHKGTTAVSVALILLMSFYYYYYFGCNVLFFSSRRKYSSRLQFWSCAVLACRGVGKIWEIEESRYYPNLIDSTVGKVLGLIECYQILGK